MIELTVEMLDAMEPGYMFAMGTASDNCLGINLSGSDKLLRWIAVRGTGMPDWAIYAHFAEHDPDWIRRHGDKLHNPDNIRRVIPCTDEAFARYRP